MPVSLKESRAATEMAKVLYSFLPGSGARSWKGHITFQTVSNDVGVGEFWQGGSKEPAIAALLERTLEYRRDLFEKLILTIVKEGLKYRKKKNDPISEDEISNHARRTWYDEVPSKGAKNHLDPFYGANPINCGFIETCTFIRVLHFQFLIGIYCFEKYVLNICTL